MDESANFYTEHNENIVTYAKIPKEDVKFLSRLTPFMIAEIQNSKLAELSANDDILSIGFYSEEQEVLYTENIRNANTDEMNLDKSFEKFGLTGDGVTVLQVEGGYVRADMDNYNEIPYPENIRLVINQNIYLPTDTDAITCGGTSHANAVVSALQSVASNIFVYSVRSSLFEDIEWAIENCNIDLINASVGYDDDGDIRYLNQWYDALVSSYGVSIVASAGNDYVSFSDNWPIVLSPSSTYNSISVGAYDSDDGRMYNYRYNPADNADVVRYKPDLVAAGYGTSISAPYVSGIVALMIEMNAGVATNPALVKAILMASCHEKALPFSLSDTQENMFDGLTLKQGAGKVDAYKALSIVLMGSYETGTIPYGSQNVNTISYPYDTNVNVSLVWLKGNMFPFGLGPGTVDSSNAVSIPLQELTLDIANNGNILETSNVTNSGKQLVYFSADEDTQYDIHITKTSNNTTPVSYAYAWSASVQNELTTALINGEMAKGQQISATVQCNNGITVGANEVDYQWQYSANGTTWTNINGATLSSYTLTSQEFNKYIRCIIIPKSSSGILPISVIAESDLKVIVYGDSNLSGTVNSKDVTAVQKYVAGIIDFTDDQKRAADVSGEGNVNAYDVTLIQEYIAGVISVFPVE